MVGFKVKYYWFQIGSEDFLFSFFSTVAYNLENQKWGTKFPVIMNELYQGELKSTSIPMAIKELGSIKQGLANLPPDKIIWDIENLFAKPPWETSISSDITNLSNYFVTSDGENFITVFNHALEKANELNCGVAITII
ncbi:immunity 70 family protein [Clostridioides difficile]|nr:hypothetical protein [Clostridioides difficile]EGT4001833.1 hypothetical protein [Clostridioides difficile]MBH6909674.1 immunity 70 family protein [Clostridioides difficile]MBH7982291.1 immunity 70 family protein [Clostridioides difficile]MBH8031567.1 immunity 70 family protein [Clostridioides difficile]